MKFGRVVLILILLVGLVGGSSGGWYYLQTKDTVPLSISTSPSDANITVNGKTVSGTTLRVHRGAYSISVAKDGYHESHKVYNIQDDINKMSITLTQEPAPLISSLLRGNGYEAAVKQHPVLQKLPYESLLLSIDYTPTSTLDSLVLSVKAYDGYRQGVIDQLRSWGYEPAEYNVVFKDYSNPFVL